ncbi:hypothetical protein BOTCAL_0268g00150 [Botryotinia calthae]|uniref:Uncharacterized protein n=1 Tax=Botryotinia calthae TaxID=38488 RepID=A0A4Y8CYG3_9HELO|nr:hypothetical protein BOTCAL_0268g00150 [Botryotinia calthae]
MNLDLPPNAAWAAKAFAPGKKGSTISTTTKNGHSTFGTPAPVLPPPANPPPVVAPPKRNNGTPFSMAGSPFNQPATSSPAPAPHVPPPYVPSSFLPPTAVAAPIPYGNIPPYTPSTNPSAVAPAFPPFLPQVSSAPVPAPAFPASSPFTSLPPPQNPSAVAPPAAAPMFGSTPFSFSFATPVPATAPAPNPVASNLFSSAFGQPALASAVPSPMPLPPSSLLFYAQQQPPSPFFSPISALIQFCPHRPAAPVPAEPPSPEIFFDSENQRIIEEMDYFLIRGAGCTDEYSQHINSFEEMEWDRTDDYLMDCYDIL